MTPNASVRALLVIVLVTCAGCVSVRRDAPDVAYPADWPRKQVADSCAVFTGTYKYFGEVYPADRGYSAEIIELFFEHREGPGAYPETASLVVAGDQPASLTLHGAVPEQMPIQAQCSQGRLIIDKETRGSSDGTPYELRQHSELWQGPRGELIGYASWGMRSGLSCCAGTTPIGERKWFLIERVK